MASLLKDFEPDNRPVYFRSSGVFLFNLVCLKYKNNVHNRLFTYDNKIDRKICLIWPKFIDVQILDT